jgi:type IV secretion system protein VirB9
MSKFVPLALLLCWAVAQADTIPKASPRDPRIGIADFKDDEVYSILVAKGTVTRIILAPGETVLKSGTGFPASCTTTSEWCIEAEKGADQIWVKPLTGATANNLELQTTRGDYSIRFVVAPGAEKAKAVFYRVIFRHPIALLGATRLALPTPQIENDQPAASSPAAQAKSSPDAVVLTPQVRNYDYSKKHTPDAADLAPSVVFDDGRFTYLRFEKAQEVPSVFMYGPDGAEVRVATHSERLAGSPEHPEDKVERDYLVVQRISRKLTLRLGAAVIELINNKFDSKGIETLNGTTTEKLVRDDKKDDKQ